jgi:phospholipase C
MITLFINYGAWYISQVLDILVSNPEVFSKTVFLINYDEADGSFDHIVPPTVPPTPGAGASTVSTENEIVTTSIPNGPIGLSTRVPFIAISPWSKGGYVVLRAQTRRAASPECQSLPVTHPRA